MNDYFEGLTPSQAYLLLEKNALDYEGDDSEWVEIVAGMNFKPGDVTKTIQCSLDGEWYHVNANRSFRPDGTAVIQIEKVYPVILCGPDHDFDLEIIGVSQVN